MTKEKVNIARVKGTAKKKEEKVFNQMIRKTGLSLFRLSEQERAGAAALFFLRIQKKQQHGSFFSPF